MVVLFAWQNGWKSQFLEEEKIILVVGQMPIKIYQFTYKRWKKVVMLNVILSKDETYGDISPVRLMSNGITALQYRLLVVVITCALLCILNILEVVNAVVNHKVS
jgi:hypothetical protein